jgi:SSS family solute:Na+ symporter
MWGIVLTDAIQTTVILISIPVIAVASYSLLYDHHFVLSDVFATPFIPRGTLVKFIYYVVPFLLAISVSYDAYLRYQSARNPKIARWGCVIAGIIVILIGMLTSSIGVVARLVYPEVKEGMFSYVVIHSLPPVVAGIAIAAILGAAMSSGACLLVAMGAAFSRDLYNKFFFPHAKLDELRYSKLLSRLAVGLSAVAGILVAQHLTDILDAIIIFNYPYMGSLLIPLLAGVLWKGATKKGAVAAIFTGGFIGVGAFLAGIPGPLHNWVNPELGLFIAYTVSLVVLIAVSKSTKKTL